jgi:hypothetical protein
MAADFPASIPVIVRVLPTDMMDGAGTESDVLHNDLADEVEALATVLGVTGSVVPTTVEARITALQSSATPETASTIGTLIAGSADKATPVDADSIAISDSAAAGILKRLSWANVKAALNSLYARLAGASGGQTLTGGTAAGENLTLLSTSNATKGAVIFGTASEYDHVNDRIGVGTLTPAAKIHALSTTEQLRLGFDASNFASTTVSAGGVVANTATGGQWTYRATSSSATLGAELISNGTFASDLSGWTDSGASWSWSAGTALHTAGSSTTLTQAEAVTNGSTYQIGITITGRTAGSISVALGAVSVIESGVSTAFTATFTRTVVAGATGLENLVITPTSDFNGSIDNVSLKAVTLGSVTPSLTVLDSSAASSLEIRATTQGLGNLSMGRNSQRSITVGSNNCSIGVEAQYSITSGNFNSAFGRDAQYSLTIGSLNSAFGTYAQRALTSGSFNTSVGRDANRSLTTGSSNTSIGSYAQYSATTGFGNTACGRDAQYALTSGSTNSAFGVSAQAALTTGSSNSAMGPEAQRSLVSGGSNASFGSNAQRYLANGSTAATIADNSVYIGASTKQSADSITNENVFGYNAIGLGSNTVAIGDLNITRTGLRGSVDIVASSSTTAGVTQAALVAAWTDSTHATRKARLTVSAYDTAAREAIRAEADGTVARLGFYGATAVVKPTALTATVAAAPAGGTGTAAGGWDTAVNRDLAIATINNLKTRVDQLESKLQALGLLA